MNVIKNQLKDKKNIVRAAVTVVLLAVVLGIFYYFKGISEFYMSLEDKLWVVLCAGLTVVLMLLRFKLPKALRVVGEVACILLTPYVLFSRLEPLVNNMETYKPEATVFNYLLILAIILVIYALSSHAGIAVGVGGLAVYIYYLADYFVIQFRGTPILFSDILSWKTAAAVSGGYHYVLNSNIVITFYILALIIGAASFFGTFQKKWKERLVVFVPGIIFGIGVFALLIKTDILTNKGLEAAAFIPIESANENGLFVNDILTTKASLLEVPEGYSAEKVKEIIRKYSSGMTDTASGEASTETSQNSKGGSAVTSQNAPGGILPNIIIIMNESFTDLDYLETVKTSEDTIPKFKALSENCVKGTLISSILGGNTPNSEFECLTGCSMAFLPTGMVAYQQMIDSKLPTLVSTLSKYGYTNTAVHLYNPEFFDRNRIYPLLGFDDFININTATIDVDYLRDYATDESSFNQLINLYESKEDYNPMFSFCVTIQNHGGYWWGTTDISVLNSESPYATEYASILKVTDDSFAQFLEYFANAEEPTIVCMFGDHQPFLFDDFYDAIWEGCDYSDSEKRYMQAKTPFVIWANFDIEEKDMGEMSINYLGPAIMKAAGLPMSDYFEYLDNLRETLPVICAIGFKDSEGNYFTDIKSSEYRDLITEYQYLQYNYLKGNVMKEFYGE